MLTGADITVVPPPSAPEREEAAWKTVRQKRAAEASVAPHVTARAAASAPAAPNADLARAVSEEELTHALDTVFGKPSPGGGPQWIAVPRWSWFCHMCDTHIRPPDIAVASVTRTPSGHWRIVCKPCEWVHLVDDFALAEPVYQAVMAAAAEALGAPDTAATWDPRERRFRTVTGHLVDGRQ